MFVYGRVQSGSGISEDLRATQISLERSATIRNTRQVNMNTEWLSNKQLQRRKLSTFVAQEGPHDKPSTTP
jgi:hypothetical protein